MTDTGALVGRRLRVHFNLHKGGFSVTDPRLGRVIAHVDDITLTDVTFRVQPGGLARIRETGVRQVMAYVVGTVAEVATEPDLTGCPPVRFNPHRDDTFVCDGQPVHHAERVTFAAGRGWLPATTTPDPCQLCAYLHHGGPAGHLPQCTSNEPCADAANRGEACPCQQATTTN